MKLKLKGLISSQRTILLFVVIVFLVQIYKMYSFINDYSVNIPFTDQWYYFREIWQDKNAIDLFFLQIGPHRMGLAFVIDSLILAVTEWNVRSLAFVNGFYFVLAAVLALFLKRFIFRKFDYSDIVIPGLFLALSQFEMLTIDPFSAYGSFPLLLLMLYIFSWFIQNPKLRYISVLILNFLLVFSAFGLVVSVFTLWRILCDFKTQLLSGKRSVGISFVFVAYLLSTGLFFIDYRLIQPAELGCSQFLDPNILSYLIYQFLMFANTFGFGSWSPGIFNYTIGYFATCLTVYILFKTVKCGLYKKRGRAFFAISVLAWYSVSFAMLSSIGRSCLGLEYSQSSRYITYMIPGMLSIYFFLLSLKSSKIKILELVFFVLLIFRAEKVILTRDMPLYVDYAANKQKWIECLVLNNDLDYCDFRISDNPLYWNYRMKVVVKENLNFLRYHKYGFFKDRI